MSGHETNDATVFEAVEGNLLVHVNRLTFGRGRICVGPAGTLYYNEHW